MALANGASVQLYMALANGASVQEVQAMLEQDKNITRRLDLAMKRGSPVDEVALAVLRFDPDVTAWQDESGKTPCKWILSMESRKAPGLGS
jgi:hypothetical protein